MNKIGGREAVRQRIEELARGETEQAVDPNQLARTALEAKATDLAIHAMLERIDLRFGLYFEDAMKGKRPVRKVARGIIALGDLPLPVPPYGEPACFRRPPSTRASSDGWLPNSRPPASQGPSPTQSDLGGAAVTITAIPATFQKSRRVAATMFRWMLPTRLRQFVMATDGKVGPSGRSPKGLFRLVHNWH